MIVIVIVILMVMVMVIVIGDSNNNECRLPGSNLTPLSGGRAEVGTAEA